MAFTVETQHNVIMYLVVHSLLISGRSGLVTLSLFCSALVPVCNVDGGAEAGAGAAYPAGGAQPGAARQGPGGRPRHLPQEGHGHLRPLQKCGGERGTLQRQNAENLKQIFPEKEYRGLSPNFHIHVSVSELHIYSHEGVCLFCWRKYVDRSWEYINRSQTHECGNWG
jgi:hypothetical protein